MTKTHYDAIVVGAGPGGATTAYHLANSGVRTLLLEKQKLPRYKTCGGGITFKAAQVLPFDLSPVIERTLDKMSFSWKTGKPYTLQSQDPLVYMVQRSRFDNFLTEQAVHAGAELMDEVAVKNVELDDAGVTLQTTRDTFTADYLVGADGATGRVARSLGLMADRWTLAAIESELEVDSATMEYWHDKIGIDLGELRASYGWVFPKGDHLSVGVGGLPTLTDFGSRLKRYDSKHTAARVPGVVKTLRSHGYVLPCRTPGAAVQKGNALLVGDAAGLVEAFTGEGIYWAIRSGTVAANSIITATGQPAYQQQIDALLMPDILSARRWWQVYIRAPRACYSLPKHVPVFWSAVRKIMRGERRFTDIRRHLGPLGFMESLLPHKVEGLRLAD